jgi:hypothetical protein
LLCICLVMAQCAPAVLMQAKVLRVPCLCLSLTLRLSPAMNNDPTLPPPPPANTPPAAPSSGQPVGPSRPAGRGKTLSQAKMAAAKSVLDRGTLQTVFASLVEQAAAVNALALAAAGVSISGPPRRGRKAGKKRGARGNGSPQHGDAPATTVGSPAAAAPNQRLPTHGGAAPAIPALGAAAAPSPALVVCDDRTPASKRLRDPEDPEDPEGPEGGPSSMDH